MSEAVKVEPRNKELSNSPIMDCTAGESTVVMDSSAEVCTWNGTEFAEGSVVECDGERFECSFGQWVKQA